MAQTPVYALPYQTTNDAPNGPLLGQQLAEAVEAELQRIDVALAAGITAQIGTVATTQSTTSTSYTDLATAGPSVTVTIGQSGLALVIVTAFAFNGTASQVNYMSYQVSGATSRSPSDAKAMILHSETVNGQGRQSAMHLETGLAPGSTTFTAKYRVNGGNGSFANRTLIVVTW